MSYARRLFTLHSVMPRPKRAVKVTSIRTRTQQQMAMIEDMRYAMPVAMYMGLLHSAATTGFLPLYDTNNQPTGQFDDLDTKQRIDVAKYMVDKVMSSRLPSPDQLGPDTSAEVESIRDALDITEMSTDQLLALAQSDAPKEST